MGRAKAFAFLLALYATCPAWGQPTAKDSADGLNEHDVVITAIGESPTLRAAFLDLRAARAAQRSEEARYLPVFTAALTGSYSRTPIATLGGVNITQGSSVEASVGLSQQLPVGTQMSLQVTGSESRRRINPIPTMNTTIDLGPIYNTEVRATVTQPLLRGAGRDVGALQERLATRRKEAATEQRDYVASNLLRSVLKAYWELSYASAARLEQERSRDLSKRQYDEARQRVELGLLAEAEALQLATELASLEESVAQAEGARRTRAVELGALLGRIPDDSDALHAMEGPESFELEERDAAAWAEQAMARSSELRALLANAALTREQVAAAEDAALARLDVTGWVSLQGLGYQNALDPFAQVGRASAPSAFVSLELELPFDNTRLRSSAEQSRLESDASEARVREQTLTVRAAISNQVNALRVARRSIELAEQTVQLADALATAEEDRYALGTTTATTVIIARDAVRNARLRLLRAQADKNLAAVDLAHLSGELLDRYSARSYGVLQ